MVTIISKNRKKIYLVYLKNYRHLKHKREFRQKVTIFRLLWLFFVIFVVLNFATLSIDNISVITIKNNNKNRPTFREIALCCRDKN